MNTHAVNIDRGTLSALLVMGPKVPTYANAVPAHDALVAAGYATKAPMGDDRWEYKITQAGADYLASTKSAK
jgi:hypothetical protein